MSSHLETHHATLRWLIARIRTSKPEAVSSFLFDEFADVLEGHLALVDRTVLPSLGLLGVRDWQGYVDMHWYLKRSLAELRAGNRLGDTFAKRLSAMCDRLDRQMMREATELSPLARALQASAPSAAVAGATSV
jgi:hypothetical protein